MKKLIIFIIVLAFSFIQITTFAFSMWDNSNNGVRIGILEDVKISKETTGSVLTIIGNADISNNVNGDVIIVFGDATIDAKVSGNVVAVFGTVVLKDNAKISGDFISVGNVEKSSNAGILGDYKSIDIHNFNLDTSKQSILIIIKSFMLIIFVFFVFIIGLPLLMLFNNRFQNLTSDIELRLGKKFFMGFPGFIICFITLVLLSITGLVPLVYFFYAILIEIVVSIFLGKVILNLFNTQANIYILFIFGLLLLVILKAVFIFLIHVNGFPVGVGVCFGFDILVNMLGTGILIESQFGKKYSN